MLGSHRLCLHAGTRLLDHKILLLLGQAWNHHLILKRYVTKLLERGVPVVVYAVWS